MGRNAVLWDGCVSIEYKNVELDVDVTAKGTYYYYPGCMYRKNGDPGDPPEEDTTVEKIEIETVYLDGADIASWLKDEVIKEIEELCIEAIEDGQLGSGESMEPEPYEPDDY